MKRDLNLVRENKPPYETQPTYPKATIDQKFIQAYILVYDCSEDNINKNTKLGNKKTSFEQALSMLKSITDIEKTSKDQAKACTIKFLVGNKKDMKLKRYLIDNQ